MKVMAIFRLRNTDHGTIRAGVETFEKMGSPGMEALWMSADAKTAVGFYEIDEPSELHKYATLYAPYFEHIETHLVSDASAGTAYMKEGLGLVP